MGSTLREETALKLIQALNETTAALRELRRDLRDNAPRQGVMTTKQAMAYLGVSRSTLHQLASLYRLPHVKLGRKKVVFMVKDLDAFLNARRIASSRDASRVYDGRRKLL